MGSHAPAEGYSTFLDRFVKVVNDHNTELIMPMMSPDAVWERAVGPEAHGRRFVGRGEIEAGVQHYFDLFPDCQWTDTTTYIDEGQDVATVEWLFSYTTADGEKDAVRGVDVLGFKDGLIATKRTYHKNRNVN